MRSGAILGAAAAVWLGCGFATGASAQQPMTLSVPANPSDVQVNVAPYLWLPFARASLKYDLPPGIGGRLPTDVTTGPGDYLSKLNFAAMIAADVRYDRFSVLTDFIYTNFSATSSATRIRSVDILGQPSLPITGGLQTSAGTTFKATIWTLAGGYTVLQEDWGNLDLIAGLRGMSINTRTNYSLGLSVTGPRGNGPAFGGIGYVSGINNIWNGIAGFRGRVRLGDAGWFIPYYFDIGAGGSQLTWQISSGVGYQTGPVALSVAFRYLSFEQGSSSTVKHLGLGGPMLMVNISF